MSVLAGLGWGKSFALSDCADAPVAMRSPERMTTEDDSAFVFIGLREVKETSGKGKRKVEGGRALHFRCATSDLSDTGRAWGVLPGALKKRFRLTPETNLNKLNSGFVQMRWRVLHP